LHFVSGEPTTLHLVPALVIVTLLAAGSLWLARFLVKDAMAIRRPRESRVYRALAVGGDSIARAYVVTGDVRALRVYFSDGEQIAIHAGRSDAHTLLSLVAEHAPEALDG
ncbi:MAG TPA: hypothetical protein VK762_32300, partial [Polyangiaceae bacterium]|nr:hypothetical protein [Polyangiaceae bacterium]